MIQIGRLCVKITGRDSGRKCVVVDIINNNLVLIDGQTRRRKCNIRHLEPLKQAIDIKKGAPHDIVAKEFKKLGIEVLETKPKKKTEKPKKIRKVKEKPAEAKEAKSAQEKKPKKEAAAKKKEEKPAAKKKK